MTSEHLKGMLQAKDALTSGIDVAGADEESILTDDSLTSEEKGTRLQKLLLSAASDGNTEVVRQILGGRAKEYINIDAKDDSGSTALIYASCFGNEDIVVELLRYGASVDEPDQSEWTSLMWAINNHHKTIVERLMESGASLTHKTSTGRSAIDFITPHSEIYLYMKEHGYIEASDKDDFYDDGLTSTRGFGGEEPDQLMMESAFHFDVPMSHLRIDDDEIDLGAIDDDSEQDFLWDRCLPDQMFVFNESDIPKILDIGITNMEPKRSVSQKPIPANLLFLSARYAHYYGSAEILDSLLSPAFQRIRSCIMAKKEDIAFLSFWLSNCTLLLYYLRKDVGLFPASVQHQEKLAELITDTTVLISQDAERRLELVLNASILDYQTIPGLDEIHFQSEWRIFRSNKKPKSHKEEMEETYRPPSPKRKMLPSPRNITSILSSVLFVTDLYEVHPIIVQQLMSQIFYWLGTVLFNRIMSNRKYLARARAMQIRLNISAIEDWARSNNRKPEEIRDDFHSGAGQKYPSISELCRRHFTPLVEMLQWLQCFTAIGNDLSNVGATLQQLGALNANQLQHAANKYRAEVGEKALSKEYKLYLSQLEIHHTRADSTYFNPVNTTIHDIMNGKPKQKEAPPPVEKPELNVPKVLERPDNNSNTEKLADPTEKSDPAPEPKTEKEQAVENADTVAPVKPSSSIVAPSHISEDDADDNELYLDASVVLPFVIPTLTEMIVIWGAGIGGVQKKRAKKYEPSLPTEFLDKLEVVGGGTAVEGNYEVNINPIFADLKAPKPSVHRSWGDEGVEDLLNSEEYHTVW